jgi:hypothetical protein
MSRLRSTGCTASIASGSRRGWPSSDRRIARAAQGAAAGTAGHEPDRGGVDAGSLPALAESVSGMRGLELRGLMCMPEPAADEAAQRAHLPAAARAPA